MTALKKLIIKRIQSAGPITLADYMADCLMHPEHGYYQKEKVFGKDGDFITAPEVSQMFGEMLALWLIDRWQHMGAPSAFNLIEMGPGRGTLMADILRTAKAAPDFLSAANVHFIETSVQLRELQKEKLPEDMSATWHNDVANLPDGPCLVVANEFFDALPIHQFEMRDGKWLERCIATDGESLAFTLSPPGPKVALIDTLLQDAPDTSIAEICPAALSISGAIAKHITDHGGAALVIDYGYLKAACGDTFQALKDHEYTNPFDEPGSADLTAHVNFAQIAQASKLPFLTNTQGQFLMHMGIGLRAQALANDTAKEKQASILKDLKRLTAPDEMGELFKVLAIQSKGLPSPPGF